MARQPAFHLFGFPIHVRSGFVVFMALVIVVNGGELGLWIAGSAAALTLLHELGHAFAARATGARAEISLDFLAGYASFVPVRPLKRWERAGISIAGPAVQIGVGVGALILMGVNPIDPDSYGRSAASLAIWWTGPIMGLFNLVPVLPLDGGHIVMAGLDRIVPGRSKSIMLWFSLVLTIGAGVYLFLQPGLQFAAYVVLFPLFVQLQMLFAGSAAARRSPRTGMATAESVAWINGDLSRFEHGLIPSPWYRADQQVAQGRPDDARALLVADFAEPEAPDWWPPDAASPERLASLVTLLPQPLPTGRLYSEHVLANVLLRICAHDAAASYAAASFGRHPSTTAATVVARAAGALGDVDTAIGWLRAAIQADTDPEGLSITMTSAPELESARRDTRFSELLQLAES